MDKKIITVLGTVAVEDMGVTDAHSHIWISRQQVSAKHPPVLDQKELILDELRAYKAAGGGSQIDCQPGGAGRDGRQLRDLSRASGVHIVACTGFHLQEYYPPDAKIWKMKTDQAADYFLTEIKNGLEETREADQPVFPGFIKIAVLESTQQSPQDLIQAALHASLESGLVIEMHTEKGAGVEGFLELFIKLGLSPDKLVICHIDKRPDLGLHKELAEAGCILEYDTFFRPKYHPDNNLWRLIPGMVEAGYQTSLALATDLADKKLWRAMGNGPGLRGFVGEIKARLEDQIEDQEIVNGLLGGNICQRLGVINEEQ